MKRKRPPKRRNPVARALKRLKPRVVRLRTRYTRKGRKPAGAED